MRPVGPSEVAAVHVDSHGTNKSWSNHIDERVRQFAGRKDLALWHGRVPFAVWSERKVIGYAGGLDSRQPTHSGDDLLEDFAALRLSGFFCGSTVVVIDFDGGGVIGLEAEINVEHPDEAAEQQTRAHQQHARQCNFEDDQRGADAFVFAAQACARTGVLEHLLEIAAGDPGSRKQTEDRCGENGNENGPAERLAIDVQAAEEWQSH